MGLCMGSFFDWRILRASRRVVRGSALTYEVLGRVVSHTLNRCNETRAKTLLSSLRPPPIIPS